MVIYEEISRDAFLFPVWLTPSHPDPIEMARKASPTTALNTEFAFNSHKTT